MIGMAARKFIEIRIANTFHTCTQCHAEIGRGDEYKREAVPPWEMGGFWLVIKRCYHCRGAA